MISSHSPLPPQPAAPARRAFQMDEAWNTAPGTGKAGANAGSEPEQRSFQPGDDDLDGSQKARPCGGCILAGLFS